MTPAEAEDIAREALKLMAGYPSLRLTHEEAARTAATFVAALAGMPLWAIRKACLDWACGRVQGSNPAFPPSAPELRLATNKAAAFRQHEAGTIDVILKAEVERLPTDEERAKALAYWHDTVRPMLQHTDVSDKPSATTSREEQIEANDRLRERERRQQGARPGGTRTPQMDQYLGRMRAEYGINEDVREDDYAER